MRRYLESPQTNEKSKSDAPQGLISSIAPYFGWCVAVKLSIAFADCRRRRILQRIERENSKRARKKRRVLAGKTRTRQKPTLPPRDNPCPHTCRLPSRRGHDWYHGNRPHRCTSNHHASFGDHPFQFPKNFR